MKIKLHGYSKRVSKDYKYMYIRLCITKNKWYDSHGTCMQSGLQNLNTYIQMIIIIIINK